MPWSTAGLRAYMFDVDYKNITSPICSLKICGSIPNESGDWILTATGLTPAHYLSLKETLKAVSLVPPVLEYKDTEKKLRWLVVVRQPLLIF